jgi:hypothetical protein
VILHFFQFVEKFKEIKELTKQEKEQDTLSLNQVHNNNESSTDNLDPGVEDSGSASELPVSIKYGPFLMAMNIHIA